MKKFLNDTSFPDSQSILYYVTKFSVTFFYVLIFFFRQTEPWGFHERLAPGKFTGCKDNFACLVWPSKKNVFLQKKLRWKIFFCLWKCVWRQYVQEITNHKLQKHCQHNRNIRWIMTYKPNLKYHDDPSTEGHIFLVTIVMTLCKPNAFYFTYTVIQWDII